MQLKFGTDGIRNIIGETPFNIEDLKNFSAAIAIWIVQKYGSDSNILIYNDTRESCNWIKSMIKSILMLYKINIYDANILPTPAFFHYYKKIFLKKNKKINIDCAIVISGSHNRFNENGIKILDKFSKINLHDEQIISQIYNKLDNKFDKIEINYNKFGKNFYKYKYFKEDYINNIIRLFDKNLLKNIKIVLDTANGSTYNIAPIIFKKLGAQVITINNKPDGKNINKNCGSLYTDKLIKKVIKEKALFGFAFDGDGDRVIAVNRFGQVKDGDDILAILSNSQEYKNQKQIVGTVMSNLGLERYLNNYNKELIRAQVGDKYILKSLEEKNLLLAGEPSGHIIMKNLLSSGDGILASIKLSEIAILNNNLNLDSFEKYPQIIINIQVKEKKEDLNSENIKNIIENAKEKISFDGKILIRYSGTENYLRIMTESKDKLLTENMALLLAKKLEKYFNN